GSAAARRDRAGNLRRRGGWRSFFSDSSASAHATHREPCHPGGLIHAQGNGRWQRRWRRGRAAASGSSGGLSAGGWRRCCACCCRPCPSPRAVPPGRPHSCTRERAMAKALAAGASSRFWNIWRLVGWGLAAMLLLLPLVATQCTAGVMWTALDFLAAGIIIGGTGLAFEFLVRRGGGLAYRLGAAVMLAAGFLLVWINLAVGIIGSEEDPRNLVYFVVLLIALAGAIGPGFAARG